MVQYGQRSIAAVCQRSQKYTHRRGWTADRGWLLAWKVDGWRVGGWCCVVRMYVRSMPASQPSASSPVVRPAACSRRACYVDRAQHSVEPRAPTHGNLRFPTAPHTAHQPSTLAHLHCSLTTQPTQHFIDHTRLRYRLLPRSELSSQSIDFLPLPSPSLSRPPCCHFSALALPLAPCPLPSSCLPPPPSCPAPSSLTTLRAR